MNRTAKRRVGIFYVSLPSKTQGPNWSKKGDAVITTKRPSFPLRFVFVRCEVAKSRTLLGALNEAKPRRGESVMNTHYID